MENINIEKIAQKLGLKESQVLRNYFSAVLEFDPNDHIAKKALEDLEGSPPQK